MSAAAARALVRFSCLNSDRFSLANISDYTVFVRTVNSHTSNVYSILTCTVESQHPELRLRDNVPTKYGNLACQVPGNMQLNRLKQFPPPKKRKKKEVWELSVR